MEGRTFRMAVNGHSFDDHPVGTSVPQENVLGPLLLTVSFDYIFFQLVPQAYTYADGCTLTVNNVLTKPKPRDHQPRPRKSPEVEVLRLLL